MLTKLQLPLEQSWDSNSKVASLTVEINKSFRPNSLFENLTLLKIKDAPVFGLGD